MPAAVLRGFEIDIRIRIVPEHLNERLRLDIAPFCKSMVVERTGEIHE